jgi:hypothetical protein
LSRTRVLPVFLLMTAAIFVMTGVAWLSGRNQAEVDTGSTEIQPLVATETMTRDQVLLRWNDLGTGTSYDIDVYTTDLKPLAQGRNLATPEFQVPSDAFTGLTPGTSVSWRVTARFPDGRTVSSPSFVSVVRKK